VAFALLFMHSYPILKVDQQTHKNLPEAEHWQSAFTYKMVGALRGIVENKPRVMQAFRLGIGIGLLIEVLRKLIKNRQSFKQFVARGRAGRVTSFLLDAVFLPSPYAFAFGGFVELPTILWYSFGGAAGSLYEMAEARLSSRGKDRAGGELPSDMSSTSLIGGGFIAGDALSALAIALYGIWQATR